MEIEGGLLLQSVDGQTMHFPWETVKHSKLLKVLTLNHDFTPNPEPIFVNVEMSVLLLIRKLLSTELLSTELLPRDDYCYVTLIKLTKAAAYLIIPKLVDYCTTAFATMMLTMTSRQLRSLCEVDNDFNDVDLQLIIDENDGVICL